MWTAVRVQSSVGGEVRPGSLVPAYCLAASLAASVRWLLDNASAWKCSPNNEVG